MAIFRLEVGDKGPDGLLRQAYYRAFTEEDQAIQSIDVELKRDSHRISYLTANLFDPDHAVFDQIDDPSFFDVPVVLYVTPPANALTSTRPVKVFEGKITTARLSLGSLSSTELVAHDYSIDARRVARLKTYRGLTSVQLCYAIARDYGLEVKVENLGSIELAQRNLYITHSSSDWDFLAQQLRSDGLQIRVEGKKVIISHQPSTSYSRVFRPGDGLIQRFNVEINHVKRAGHEGNIVSRDPFGNGKIRSLKGDELKTAVAQRGGAAVMRNKPLGAAKASTSGAHTEDRADWRNYAQMASHRKDTLSFTARLLPDLYLSHQLDFSGFGPKVDTVFDSHVAPLISQAVSFIGGSALGQQIASAPVQVEYPWDVTSIRHRIIPNASILETEVSAQRRASKQSVAKAKKTSTVPLEHDEPKTKAP